MTGSERLFPRASNTRKQFLPLWVRPKTLSFFLLLILMVGLVTCKVKADLKVAKLEVFLTAPPSLSTDKLQRSLRFAVLSDLHVDDSLQSYHALKVLVENVLQNSPQFVLLLGDYTQSPDSVINLNQHRVLVSEILGDLTDVPTIAVLGNYENWIEPSQWSLALNNVGIRVLRNETSKLTIGGNFVCFRGLGDAFTNAFAFVDFPVECNGLPQITLTHDPAGAFDTRMKGLIFAGHTHCGQIRLPYFGSIWIPSNAPENGTCGLYTDEQRLLWVSSGVGHSILPVRFGAKAQWDLVQLTYPNI